MIILYKSSIVRWGEEYHFDLFIPDIYVEGIYSVDGRILLLPITGSGKFTGNFSKFSKNVVFGCNEFFYFTNYWTTATTSGSVKCILRKYSPDEIVKIHKIDIKVKLGSGSIKLRNLFNGDKVLGMYLSVCEMEEQIVIMKRIVTGEAVNQVINDNFDLLSKDIVPLVERALQRTFKKLANKISNRFTYSQLFPTTPVL